MEEWLDGKGLVNVWKGKPSAVCEPAFVINCRFFSSKVKNFSIITSHDINSGKLLTIFLIFKNSPHDKNKNGLFVDP